MQRREQGPGSIALSAPAGSGEREGASCDSSLARRVGVGGACRRARRSALGDRPEFHPRHQSRVGPARTISSCVAGIQPVRLRSAVRGAALVAGRSPARALLSGSHSGGNSDAWVLYRLEPDSYLWRSAERCKWNSAHPAPPGRPGSDPGWQPAGNRSRLSRADRRGRHLPLGILTRASGSAAWLLLVLERNPWLTQSSSRRMAGGISAVRADLLLLFPTKF